MITFSLFLIKYILSFCGFKNDKHAHVFNIDQTPLLSQTHCKNHFEFPKTSSNISIYKILLVHYEQINMEKSNTVLKTTVLFLFSDIWRHLGTKYWNSSLNFLSVCSGCEKNEFCYYPNFVRLKNFGGRMSLKVG